MDVKRYSKKLPLRLVVLALFFIGSLLLFGYVIQEVLWEKEGRFDETVFAFFHRHTDRRFTGIMSAVTFFGSSYFLFGAYIVLVLWYLLRKRTILAIDVASVGLSGYLVLYLLKTLFHRARPLGPLLKPLTNFSFPSGHASSSFIFFGLIIYLVWKEGRLKPFRYFISVFLVLFSIIIGISRIYLRYHYASDVVAGFCIGAAWISVSVWTLEHLKRKSREGKRTVLA